ncbi:hypothetical protein LCGC14_2184120 [marine sediment metagenome]|uniref:Uncharacterized protein n=1 Tax=marine sediment metagenome TaxID=412755 RepID=A0A0F9E8H3_9ZZZZ
MKRISPEEILDKFGALLNEKILNLDERLKVVAQAQLDSCEKEHLKDMQDICFLLTGEHGDELKVIHEKHQVEIQAILNGHDALLEVLFLKYEESRAKSRANWMANCKSGIELASIQSPKVNSKLRENVAKVLPTNNLCEICYLHKPGNYTRKDCVTYGKRLCALENVMVDQILALIPDEKEIARQIIEQERDKTKDIMDARARTRICPKDCISDPLVGCGLNPEPDWDSLGIDTQEFEGDYQICPYYTEVKVKMAIQGIFEILEEYGAEDNSKALTWIAFNEKYGIKGDRLTLIEILRQALKSKTFKECGIDGS